MICAGIAMKDGNFIVVSNYTCPVKAIAQADTVHSVVVKFSRPQSAGTRTAVNNAPAPDDIQNFLVPDSRNIAEASVDQTDNVIS
jgi:hypothetical protein